TTDAMAGGASVAAQDAVEGGAAGTRGALRVTGEIRPGFAFPWARTMFHPGAQPMQPVDASSRRELVFQARGDGRTYQAMLFSGPSAQGMPAMQSFAAGPDWTEVRIPLTAFAGADPAALRAVAITAGLPEGGFELFIDQVELRWVGHHRAMQQVGIRGRVRAGWRAALAPAPDSLMAASLRLGRPPWTEWVHLVWTAWVFTTPLFTPGGYNLRWAALTALSYPLFVWLYAMALLRP